MVNEEQKQLIRDTYVSVARRDYSTGEIFYQRLFEIAPEVVALFPNDMVDMRRKFIHMIGLIIAELDNTETMTTLIQQLGKRHVGYGVKPAHYDQMGEAFIWALAQVLEDKFTPAVRAAWEALYDTIAVVAIHAGST